MMNKIRMGVVAASTAAGVYLYNQEQSGDMATAPAPMEAPLIVEEGAGPSPIGLPGVTTDRPPIGPLSRTPASAPMPAPAAEPDAALLSEFPREWAAEDEGRLPAAVVSPEPVASEIPAAAPRLPGGKDIVRVYYGTNRKADRSLKPDADPGDYYTSDAAGLELGIVEVSIPKTHQRGSLETRRWYLFEKENAAKHFVLQRVVPTEEALFLRELNRDIAADPQQEAFIFIHGFGTTFEAAAWRTGQLKADLDFAGPAILYSWPSKGSINPIAYFQDRDTVRESRDELTQFLEIVGTQTGAKKIHVIAHSMGNYLLAPTLAALKQRSYLPKPMFAELVLAAPDISAEMFLDEIAPELDRSARRTTVYAADHDYALRVSHVFLQSRRLGTFLGIQRAPALPFMEIVDTANADFRLFEVGHSDYGGPILEDLKATLRGLKPTDRGLTPHHVVPSHWEVKSQPQPSSFSTSKIVQVSHSTLLPGKVKTTQPKKSGIWDSLLSWWPW